MKEQASVRTDLELAVFFNAPASSSFSICLSVFFPKNALLSICDFSVNMQYMCSYVLYETNRYCL